MASPPSASTVAPAAAADPSITDYAAAVADGSGHLPVLLISPVIHGFGRGSKELGIPTANMDMALVGPQVEALPTGIYYGWAHLPGDRGGVFKACASIGWNPQYQNRQKTVEPHLIHTFEEDFYGEELRFLVCGYVRPERSFPSLDALITEIHHDISVAKEALDQEPHKSLGTEQLDWTTTTAPPAEWRPPVVGAGDGGR